MLKDEVAAGGSDDWMTQRLRMMHRLVWSYDHAEPVWTYPHDYWLHLLCAWFSLFYHSYVRGGVDSGTTVITDGWYFKHQARFH
ncbi:MAG TPA: thymidylate kinase, partial [Chloroflexota bacterium]